MTLRKNNAFTLVELAIVLVIIGLLTAGVVGGQSLIASAKINSQVAQLRGYDTATAAFRLEYDALPGDMEYNSATAYGFTSYTYNNGDGALTGHTSTVLPTYWTYTEAMNFFPNLYEAKLINTRQALSSCSYCVGENQLFPSDKIGRGGVGILSQRDRTLHFFLGPTLKPGHSIVNPSNYFAQSASPSLTPNEARRIDSKIDDGLPDTGGVRATVVTSSYTTSFVNDTTTGASACLATTSSYNLSYNEAACRITVKLSQ